MQSKLCASEQFHPEAEKGAYTSVKEHLFKMRPGPGLGAKTSGGTNTTSSFDIFCLGAFGVTADLPTDAG